ncbi:hypothetical protein V3C99_002225, partial [Haemonchus contortus]
TSSNLEEELYKDYLKRRNKEYGYLQESQPNREEQSGGRKLGSALPSGRFKPMAQRQPSASLSDEKRSQLKGDGSYTMPDNIYRASGYVSRPLELGGDPLSAVRTLKNQMQIAAVKHRAEGLTVRANLCNNACDRLTAAESKLTAMTRERTDALVVGDSMKAHEISDNMEKLKEVAVRDTYADLLFDKHEMMAYGVDSEWSSLRKEEPPRPVSPIPPPAVPKNGLLIQLLLVLLIIFCFIFMIPKQWGATTETQTEEIEPEFEEIPNQEKPEILLPEPEVKKNSRLAELEATQNELLLAAQRDQPKHEDDGYDDPYQLPDYTGTCQFCGESAPDFKMEGRIEEHYRTSCMCMTRCRYCSKIALVAQLDEHLINRCSFLAGQMVACDACGMAIDVTDNANGMKHPMCRGRLPPSGAIWCPLCAVAVDNTKQAWKTHLLEVCYNNPRRDGPDPEPPVQSNILSAKKPTRPSSTASTKAASKRRMIDADKLVVALQAVQIKKKEAAKKKAVAAASGETPATVPS